MTRSKLSQDTKRIRELRARRAPIVVITDEMQTAARKELRSLLKLQRQHGLKAENWILATMLEVAGIPFRHQSAFERAANQPPEPKVDATGHPIEHWSLNFDKCPWNPDDPFADMPQDGENIAMGTLG